MKLIVTPEDQTQRLDLYLVSQFPSLSRRLIKLQVDDGQVLLNGQYTRVSQKLHAGDHIQLRFDPHKTPSIAKLSLPILYEDDDCLVINKPEGILTHSKGPFNPEATVATFIADKVVDQTGDRAGIVHRLDRGTSGVLICAKTPGALQWLQKQFSQRKVKKTYLAVIQGTLDPPEAVVDVPIERNPKKPKTFRVAKTGKPATTTYKLLTQGTKKSQVELKPTTGRTHQLRVHLAFLGHPIVGDSFYGGLTADRLYLHATLLEITLPNRQRKTFTATPPDSFNDILTA